MYWTDTEQFAVLYLKDAGRPKFWVLFFLILGFVEHSTRAEKDHALTLYSADIYITYTTKNGEHVSTKKTEMGR